MPSRHKILATDFSNEFVDMMRNRVLISSQKYGFIRENKTATNYVDTLKNARYRLDVYEKTGNPEYLVDACNYLMFEFMEMRGDFISTDDNEYARVV